MQDLQQTSDVRDGQRSLFCLLAGACRLRSLASIIAVFPAKRIRPRGAKLKSRVKDAVNQAPSTRDFDSLCFRKLIDSAIHQLGHQADSVVAKAITGLREVAHPIEEARLKP